jgi:hypothetical protein
LIVRLDDYAYGPALVKGVKRNGEADDHRPTNFLAGLQFVFWGKSGLDVRLKGRESLIVAIEIDGRNCLAAMFSVGCYKCPFNIVHP